MIFRTIFAGGILPMATPQTNGLADKYTAADYMNCYGKNAIRLHKTPNEQYKSISFSLVVSIEGTMDQIYHFGGTTGNGTSGRVVIYRVIGKLEQPSYGLVFYYKQEKDGSVSIYTRQRDGNPFGTVFITKRLDYVGEYKSPQMTSVDSLDVSQLTIINVS